MEPSDLPLSNNDFRAFMPVAERVIGPFTNNDMAQKRRAQRAKSARNASAPVKRPGVAQGLEARKADSG